MANTYNPNQNWQQYAGAPHDIQAGASEIFNQLEMAKMLRKQGIDPIKSDEYTKSGSGQWAAPPQIVQVGMGQGLAKLAQAGLGGYMENKANEDNLALANKLRDRNESDTQKYIAATQGTPAQPFQQGAPAGNVYTDDYTAVPAEDQKNQYQFGIPLVDAVIPTQQQKRAAMFSAIAGDNPKLSKLGQLDLTQDYRSEDKKAEVQAKILEIQQRAIEGRISKQEADARAADLRRELQASQDASRKDMVRLAASLRPAPTPTVTEIVKDGKKLKVDARDGRVIGDAPTTGKGNGMSPTAQKELIQTDEEIQGGQAALISLQQAKDINDKAMGFKGAGVVSSIGTLLPEGIRPDVVDATENLDNILTAGALPQLKAIFGGLPTEGERKVLLEIQGSSSKPASVRKEIFARAEAAAKKRLEFSQQKAKALRDGTYFSGDGGSEAPAAPSAEPKKVANDADFAALPSGAIFIDPQGNQRRKP